MTRLLLILSLVVGLVAVSVPAAAESGRQKLKRLRQEALAMKAELASYEDRAVGDFNTLSRLEGSNGFRFSKATVAISSAQVGGGHPASNMVHARVRLKKAEGWSVGAYQNERVHRTRRLYDMNLRHFRKRRN